MPSVRWTQTGDTRPTASARVAEHRERARCSSLGRRARAGPRCSRAGSRRCAAAGVAGRAHARPHPSAAGASAAARARAEELLDRPLRGALDRDLRALAERLLRDYALEAGLDPFFETVGPADRLALLLDRLDELPLRRHEIRGNPAGLLARLLERIDALKAEGIGAGRAARLGGRRASAGPPAPPSASVRVREIEFADLFDRHDAIMLEAGILDEGELVLELGRLLRDRADVAERGSASASRRLIVDELEDAGPAASRLLAALGAARQRRRLPATRRRRPCAGFRAARGEAAPSRPLVAPASRRGAGRASTSTRSPRARPRRRVGPLLALRERARPGAGGRARDRAPARRRRGRARADLRPRRLGLARGRLVAAALEERSVPFRIAGSAAFFGRPEVRDAIAWLRVLADPGDSAAVVRALTRPPVELRSVDLARCTTIARRRKLDMVSALEAALESPQLPPEARDRIQAFLKLYRAAAGALRGAARRRLRPPPDRADRLSPPPPLRGQPRDGRAAGQPLAARRAGGRLGPPRAARLDPRLRPLPARGRRGRRARRRRLPTAPPPGARAARRARAGQGARVRPRLPARPAPRRARWRAPGGPLDPRRAARRAAARAPATEVAAARRRVLAYVALSRARDALVLSWPERPRRAARRPRAIYEAARAALGGDEEVHEEELFGPAEGLHSTYRMLRDEVLEASWRAGAALSEMRLDTAEDVNRAVARFLELLKLAALIQRPAGSRRSRDARRRSTSCSAGSRRPSSARRSSARRSTSTCSTRSASAAPGASWSPRAASRRSSSSSRAAAAGSALSASDIDLYRTCPLKYKFARVFAIPQEPTINQRFGILIHNVLERYHAEELRGAAGGAERRRARGSLDRLLGLFEAGWRRTGLRLHPTTSSSTATAPSPRSPATTSATAARRRARSGSSAASRSRSARTSSAAASTASTATPTAATS